MAAQPFGFVKHLIFLLSLSFLWSATASAEVVTFDKKILPIFKAKCISCHSTKDPQGKLDLSSLKATLKGGSRGAAVKPGDAEKSLMYGQFFLPKISIQRMPPQGTPQLTRYEINLVREWINGGAK